MNCADVMIQERPKILMIEGFFASCQGALESSINHQFFDTKYLSTLFMQNFMQTEARVATSPEFLMELMKRKLLNAYDAVVVTYSQRALISTLREAGYTGPIIEVRITDDKPLDDKMRHESADYYFDSKELDSKLCELFYRK